MVVAFLGCFYGITGLTILLLPLLFRELSRPRDSVWGGLIIIFGLILIVDNDRFVGAPKFAEIVGLLVFIRFFVELSQHRLQLLTLEEKTNLKSIDRFNRSFQQSFVAFKKLGTISLEFIKAFQPQGKDKQKKWVRPEKPSNDKSIKDDDHISNNENQDQELSLQEKISSLKKHWK